MYRVHGQLKHVFETDYKDKCNGDEFKQYLLNSDINDNLKQYIININIFRGSLVRFSKTVNINPIEIHILDNARKTNIDYKIFIET